MGNLQRCRATRNSVGIGKKLSSFKQGWAERASLPTDPEHQPGGIATENADSLEAVRPAAVQLQLQKCKLMFKNLGEWKIYQQLPSGYVKHSY
jgi:hypothetical protein